jgi:hypothetical protein
MRLVALLLAAAATAPLAASAAVTPPKIVGKATIATSLQIVDHDVVVRTVRMRGPQPLSAESIERWAKPGYWTVELSGNDLKASRALCKPSFCTVIEPGHASYGARFNNLKKVTTITGPNSRTILLSGTITISGSAAITYVSGSNWYTDNNAEGFGFQYTPSPVQVSPGQQVRITIEITMPRHA